MWFVRLLEDKKIKKIDINQNVERSLLNSSPVLGASERD